MSVWCSRNECIIDDWTTISCRRSLHVYWLNYARPYLLWAVPRDIKCFEIGVNMIKSDKYKKYEVGLMVRIVRGSVGHELTQMSLNSRVNSVIVSCEFDLTHANNCELWVWFNSVFVSVVSWLGVQNQLTASWQFMVKLTDPQVNKSVVRQQGGRNKRLTELNRLFPFVADAELFSYLADPDLLLALLHRHPNCGISVPFGTDIPVHHKISHAMKPNKFTSKFIFLASLI